ncbi:MAG: adenosylcobinamide-GDP ribazoletransferase [Fusobacteriaceae bacterium]|jgi:adenosylcobinamide-GDP ribazoletransferase|nr:adenosylcobinamide-GDP ribazoletransferase [Fusobacteriaceae bacterium]
MDGIILLFKFMTRFPIFKSSKDNDEELGKSIKYFPVVGIVIGIVLYLFYSILNVLFHFNYLIIAAILVSIEIIITGGIHFVGLSVTFDSIFKYRSKQKMLDMMKETTLGANGVMVLIATIFLKILFISSFIVKEPFIILIMPVISRLNSVINCAFINGAKNTGKAKLFADNTSVHELTLSTIITFAYIVIVSIFKLTFEKYSFYVFFLILISPIITVFLGYIYGKWMKIRIGGITGYTLGAVIELSELVFLFFSYISLMRIK